MVWLGWLCLQLDSLVITGWFWMVLPVSDSLIRMVLFALGQFGYQWLVLYGVEQFGWFWMVSEGVVQFGWFWMVLEVKQDWDWEGKAPSSQVSAPPLSLHTHSPLLLDLHICQIQTAYQIHILLYYFILSRLSGAGKQV